jgi:integrase
MARTREPAEIRQRLSDAIVRKLPTPATGNKITYDSEVKGFGCRVTMAGARSFVLNYRIAGLERRYTIGSFPEWSTGAARDKAKRLKRDIDHGIDPLGEREAERTAPTIADMCARYIEEHLPRKRPSSQRDDRSMIERDIKPVLGKHKVADLQFVHVDQLHRAISSRAPFRANRVLALLSKMFSLAIRWRWRFDNPCRGVERNHENRRERYLGPAELARLAAALEAHPERTSVNLVRFLLLTGSRFGEATHATWDQFDLERGVWIKPSAHTKQKRDHRAPLSAPALALIAEMKAANGPSPYLFAGPPKTDKAGKPITTIKTTWRSICRQAGLEGTRVHDLRHTYASVLASSGLSLPVIGALLGHTQPQTTARYAHLLDDPLRQATERAAAVITASTTADVLPLRRSGR